MWPAVVQLDAPAGKMKELRKTGYKRDVVGHILRQRDSAFVRQGFCRSACSYLYISVKDVDSRGAGPAGQRALHAAARHIIVLREECLGAPTPPARRTLGPALQATGSCCNPPSGSDTLDSISSTPRFAPRGARGHALPRRASHAASWAARPNWGVRVPQDGARRGRGEGRQGERECLSDPHRVCVRPFPGVKYGTGTPCTPGTVVQYCISYPFYSSWFVLIQIFKKHTK